ncbi:nuclear transport factor 2 family protein [Candidatus Nitrospira neomarina]|uniref:Nuclear transport factor 2 family protein n=1 Tax=Candidatus Nitrospira neomarina TaxID=3020899 RepID=A0AA96GL42_9BACT|nr:nuclear transport factor 2 family protein [Candidatus Nitrospira neomarina]WNM61068.1 nuclear transport factor 2 family protein [Candidatus Nitrospira neomarina]
MSSQTTINLQDRLEDLFSYIREGRILDAINAFYAEDAAMQENDQPPTVGRKANLEREKQFMNTVKEWKRFDVTAKGVGEDVTFYETVMDWIATDGTPVHAEQVVVAKWQDGRITHERYYHNP